MVGGARHCVECWVATCASSGTGFMQEPGGTQRGLAGSKQEEKVGWGVWPSSARSGMGMG